MSFIRSGPTPREMIERLAKNDPSLTEVDLSGNTIFTMKPMEYTEKLTKALMKNTHCKFVSVAECCITDVGAKQFAAVLKSNSTIETLDLQKNKISNEGATAIAEALKDNSTLIELRLLGQPGQFGDTCLATFIAMFDENTTLRNIVWRLESRQSFRINRCLTRNKDIYRRLLEGRSLDSYDQGLLKRGNTPRELSLEQRSSSSSLESNSSSSETQKAKPQMQRKSSRAPPKQWPPPAQEDEEVEDTKNPPQEGAKLAAETRVVKPVPISPRDAKPSLEKLKERANAGDINSAFIVGRMLADGHGECEADDDAAVQYLMKAARKGHAEAAATLATFTFMGRGGLKKDPKRAVTAFTKVADKGCTTAMHNLGVLYWGGVGVERDRTKAVNYWRKAANLGHPDSYAALAAVYYASGRPEMITAAVEAWQELIEMGHIQSSALLGLAAMAGHVANVTGVHYATQLWTDASSGKEYCNDARFFLANLYATGADGVDPALQKAQQLYKEAAMEGHAESFTAIALLLLSKEQTDKAIGWLQKGVDAGAIGSMAYLGARMLSGEAPGAQVDGGISAEEKGRELLETAAALGSHDACVCLASYYEKKEGMAHKAQAMRAQAAVC